MGFNYAKKRLSLYGELSSTAMGHKTVYDGGLSDVYPYPLLGPLPSGQNITIENKITLRMLSFGIKTELKVNKFFNVEFTPMYCVVPKKETKLHFFYREFDFTIKGKDGELAGGGDTYYDTNNKGIINLRGGINCNLTNKFKLHLLYFKTLNGVSKYSKSAPFQYKLRYQGLNVQLSYNFLNLDKDD